MAFGERSSREELVHQSRFRKWEVPTAPTSGLPIVLPQVIHENQVLRKS